MAKAPVKSAAKTAPKKTAAAPKVKAATASIEKACEDALKKLQAVGLDAQLQRDIQWCLGSYNADKNPAGLYEMAQRALQVFQAAKEKKTKGITSKVTDDLEKVLSSR